MRAREIDGGKEGESEARVRKGGSAHGVASLGVGRPQWPRATQREVRDEREREMAVAV